MEKLWDRMPEHSVVLVNDAGKVTFFTKNYPADHVIYGVLDMLFTLLERVSPEERTEFVDQIHRTLVIWEMVDGWCQ